MTNMLCVKERIQRELHSLFSATSLLSLCVCTANLWNHLLLASVSTRTWFNKWSMTRLKNAMLLDTTSSYCC